MAANIDISFNTPEENYWANPVFSPWAWLPKTSTTAFAVGEMSPCMNPTGFVSNLNCPEKDPYCNCPLKTLIPVYSDSSGVTSSVLYYADLEELKKATSECASIKQVFSENWKDWYGIDFSDSTCSYNCWEPKKGELEWRAVSGAIGLCGSAQEYFPYAKRKSYPEGITVDGKKETINYNIGRDTTPTPGTNSAPEIGKFFPHYLAYSKTNATFWNTPVKTPLLRKAQTALLTHQRIKILVNGSFEIKPGNIIAIDYPTPQSKNTKEGRFAGRWMVYKVQRVITPLKHSMFLFLMRDGNYINPSVKYNVTLSKDT